jgi:hypothetical protein
MRVSEELSDQWGTEVERKNHTVTNTLWAQNIVTDFPDGVKAGGCLSWVLWSQGFLQVEKRSDPGGSRGQEGACTPGRMSLMGPLGTGSERH